MTSTWGENDPTLGNSILGWNLKYKRHNTHKKVSKETIWIEINHGGMCHKNVITTLEKK